MKSRGADQGKRRLRLHRETLRTVTGPDLAQIAGAGYFGGTFACGFNAAPKSNAWTGSADPNYGCA